MDKTTEVLKKLYWKLVRDNFQFTKSVGIPILKRQLISSEVIALGKVYPNNNNKKHLQETCSYFSFFWKELQFSHLHNLWEAIPSKWYDLIFGSKAIPICTLEIVPTLALQLWSL